ncbi:protein FAM151B [Diorhabda carinulata]|uniref:protein FAM151B n=1 Tax=Diorhabda carinulata TaxID=1163345 RepID=UPI0025A0A7AD|nr:protein FAM151B [Diorhabda carinulata]XP_057669926.1 protein FAM151B [Diorhabda carinulata]
MSNADINRFFPQIKGDLSNVIWAHAVNSQAYLQNTLQNDEVMMIEADVVYGYLTDSPNKMAVMAHSIDDTSDLSLNMFLQEIDDFNDKSDILIGKGKGLKLDFKSLDAVEASLDSILKYNKGKYPFWLNADILPGPNYDKNEFIKVNPVDAEGFLSAVKKFQYSILSLGWTTKLSNANQNYSQKYIKEMLEVIEKNKVSNELTFAVRAGLVANSLPEMKELLLNDNSTLTIWSSQDDYPGKVNVENLRKVISDIGVLKIFIDVPHNLREALHLK